MFGLPLSGLLFCSQTHERRSILIPLRFLRLHLESFRPPSLARFLHGVLSFKLCSTNARTLVLLCLFSYFHNHSLTSILISRLFCRLPSPPLSTLVSCASSSRCFALQASHQPYTHVCSSIGQLFCFQNHELRSIRITIAFYRLPSSILSTCISCSLSSRRLFFMLCMTSSHTFGLLPAVTLTISH